MKALRYIILTVMTVLVAGCTSDGEAVEDGRHPSGDGMVTVGLRITAAGGVESSSRAWQDPNARDNEMMNTWTVVVVNASDDKVVAIHSCTPTVGSSREVDDYVSLSPGNYRFYSFANISPLRVMQLLGISGSGAGSGGADEVYEVSFDEGAVVSASSANAVTVNPAGNGFNPDATDNGFGAKGIPMSNVQTKEITSSTVFDLIVVRMMAKITLQIQNQTGAAVKVESATLSNVTQNGDNILKLLPQLTQHDSMGPSHKDIQPNLGTATQGDLTTTVNQEIADDETKEVTFYVNESATPANVEGLFYLTLEVDNGGESEFRYALISNDGSEWNYIARNDYRLIPVVLDDLKFELVPYDFPPIGVYPVSVKVADVANHVYDFVFHDYGHFHLLPSVTKGGAAVPFSATTPTSGSDYKWTLINNDFTQSWFTAAAFGGSWLDSDGITANGFYRTGTGSTTVDGDDEGQAPAWYPNTAGNPQWDPSTSATYRPFVFGYIADPGSALSEDKKIYHEMKIQVYNGTTAYRQMLYRFYMTLSAEQMLYAAPAKGLSAHRRSHFER